MSGKYRFLLLIVTAVSAAVMLDGAFFSRAVEQEAAVTRGLTRSAGIAEPSASPYTFTFSLEKTPMGNVNTYLPQYGETGIDGALYYFAAFGMEVADGASSPSIVETDDYYSCANADGTLYVHKFGSAVNYAARPRKPGPRTVNAPADALALAERFIESRLLFLGYEESEVNFDGGQYVVRFINRIGNIRNYAFVTSVTVGADGVVSAMTYYRLGYERLGSVRLKSMEDAADELPPELPGSQSVQLNRCGLVYIFENSVVQPAYLFEGATGGGDTFQCFVKAAVYN